MVPSLDALRPWIALVLLGLSVLAPNAPLLAQDGLDGPFPDPRSLEDLRRAPVEELPQPQNAGRMVLDVKIDGNKDVPVEQIAPLIRTRPGRALDQTIVQEDIRRLNRTRKFINVSTEYKQSPRGLVVIYRVVERPRVNYVKYIGNKGVRQRVLEKETGLKPGQPLDPYTIDEARRKMIEFYHERGSNQVRITVLEGNKPGDRGAVFLINEGPKQKIWKVNFVGNKIASDDRLKTQIESQRPIMWLFGGTLNREKIESDVQRLTAYYRSLGFFRARIGRELRFDEDQDWVTVTFVIDEGPRYTVRNVSFVGHTIFRTEDLKQDLQLEPSEYFDQGFMNNDVARIQEYYGAHGYIFANIQAEPRFLPEPGMLDLVYAISEGNRYRVGRIDVNIHGLEGAPPHSKHRTVLNRIDLRPGDIVDVRKLRAAERRLIASGLFLNDPSRGVAPKILISPLDEGNAVGRSLDDIQRQTAEAGGRVRGQSPDNAPGPDRVLQVNVEGQMAAQDAPGAPHISRPRSAPRSLWQAPPRFRSPAPAPSGQLRPTAPAQQPPPVKPTTALPWRGANQRLEKPPAPWQAHRGVRVRAQSPSGGASANPQPQSRYTALDSRPTPRATTPVTPGPAYSGVAPAGQPIAPITQPGASGGSSFIAPPPIPLSSEALPPPGGDPLLPPGGNFNEVWENDPQVILQPDVTETQTGQFSFGVGVNSSAGVVGQIQLNERNFDISNVPTGWSDWGGAFRGGGQKFNISAVPGTQLQRYSATFTEPYLGDTPISLSVTGFLFTRLYQNWNEQRIGGNIGFGYQIRPDLSVGVALRAENVNISNPSFPTPPQLASVLGDSDLYSTKFSIGHDTRDNSFLATQGHLVRFSYEQVFGEFDFPRGEVDVRQFFLVKQRPDGSGRHVISLRGNLGVSGPDTPVFENYFAGGYSTIRGFRYRGASPVAPGGTIVGGRFQLLTSIQYMAPIKADDSIRWVAFVDAGTVTPTVNISSQAYRVAPGFGLRINVPGMGPAPIALDFAFPISKEDTDLTRTFSFFVGLQQ